MCLTLPRDKPLRSIESKKSCLGGNTSRSYQNINTSSCGSPTLVVTKKEQLEWPLWIDYKACLK